MCGGYREAWVECSEGESRKKSKKTGAQIRTEGENHGRLGRWCYFVSSALVFVAFVDVAVVMGGGATGCWVTGPSPPSFLPISFSPLPSPPLSANRRLRAASSNSSSSVDSPKFLQHPRWADPELDPGFSTTTVKEIWGQQWKKV